MALNVWTKPSGPFSVNLLNEGQTYNILPLPVENDDGVTYTVISGKLPAGMWLEDNHITGTPYEVPRDTTFSFCIRAKKDNFIADRTFSLTVSGSDIPEFLTPEGLLDVGPYKQVYVVDKSPISYQIEAFDRDSVTGQTLTYFISQGELPPGLSLSNNGLIYGKVESVTSLKPSEGNGSYDHGYYGVAPYDFACPQRQNGYDELTYDNIAYDYFYVNQPRSLNRFYEFIVSVSDGDLLATPSHKFRIYVVSSDYFRADSESMLSNTGIFTADVTYVQEPVWITPSNLGTFRANNYITLMLDVFDTGSIYYQLEEINANTIATVQSRSINYNRIGSYKITIYTTTPPAAGSYVKLNAASSLNRIVKVEFYVENEYTLTLYSPLTINVSSGLVFSFGLQGELDATAIITYRALQDNIVGSNLVATSKTKIPPEVGQYVKFKGSTVFNKIIKVELYEANAYTLTLYSPLDVNLIDDTKFLIGSKSILPPGMSFDQITGEVFGIVPAQPAVTKTYNFTISAVRYGDPDTTEINSVPKLFTVSIIGEIDSIISWNTPSKLGIISAGYVSTFNISASSTIPGATVTYTITNGQLPPGLTLSYEGEILGTVNQFSNQITFNHNKTTFDIHATLLNYTFIFTDNTTFDYDVTKFVNWTTDETRFCPSTIEYGLTTIDLAYPNYTTFDNNKTTIDRTFNFTVEARDQYYYSAISRTFSIVVDTPNKLRFSNVYAKPYMNIAHRNVWTKFINDPSIFTPDSIYRPYDINFGVQEDLSMLVYAGIETLIYYNYISLENATIKRFKFGTVNKAISYQPGTKMPIYEVVYVNMIDPLIENTLYATDNMTMWRNDIEQLGVTKWDYLPLWMRSVQPASRKDLGFITAVPLCFCKVGMADDILLNIKHSNFEFNLLDYTIDRFIINKVIGYDADKYIIFKNRSL
jgi:hypothetical protein